MSDFKNYTELELWQKARQLVTAIYLLTKNFPKEELYGLISQMRRCAVSVPSNIAEGIGRNHQKESIQFFFIAKSSLYELETQLYLSFDLKFISEESLQKSLAEAEICKKLLNGFIRYYKSKIGA